MQTYQLFSHPACPPDTVTGVRANLTVKSHWLTLRFRVETATEVVVPPLAGKGRADELWRTTCFEIFLKDEGGTSYCEFNLSPCEQWAAYNFSAWREGMRNRPMPRDPVCSWRPGSAFAIFDAAIPVAALPENAMAVSITAVIEENSGVKSYWALHHHDPKKPDFHHPDCFTAQVPSPSAP